MYDLCVIGGGAAGLSCAIAAGRLGLKVLLIDKNNKLGKKLYATGNGRCNLTNSFFDVEKHYSSSSDNYISFMDIALKDAFNKEAPNRQLIDFMGSIGISTMNDNNYIYPASAQASSVVWAMLDELKSYNIEIRSNLETTDIEGKYPSFTIKSKNEAFKAAQVVLANGGAAYKSLGGASSGYELANAMGHTIIPIRPCLCGVCVREDLTDIAGVRANATISLLDEEGKCITASKGELQITKQGLSGICIFEISSKTGKLLGENIKPQVKISFLNTKEAPDLYQSLTDRIKDNNLGERTVIGLLNCYVNDKLAQFACKLQGLDGKLKARDVDTKTLLQLADTLDAMEFHIEGLYDMEQAQLTAGGVNIEEVNPTTLESRLVEGLYIVGELLDIDGICGGYNLTFAMLTGIKAGKSVYDKNKSN